MGLSGGQRQRIALARALAVRPGILVMDDTTSAVDSETEAYIQQQLRELPFPCTKFIIAQRVSSMIDADLILVLKDGRIAERGTHEELVRLHGYYYQTYAFARTGLSRRWASMARNTFEVDEKLESPFQWKHMKRAGVYIGRHKGKMILSLALSALATVATLFIPKITEWVLDDAVPNKDVAMIGRMAAIFVGIILLSIVFTTIRSRLMGARSVRRSSTTSARTCLPTCRSCRSAITTAARRARSSCASSNYVNSVSDILSNGIINMILEIMSLVFIVIFMYSTDALLATIILGGLPFFSGGGAAAQASPAPRMAEPEQQEQQLQRLPRRIHRRRAR